MTSFYTSLMPELMTKKYLCITKMILFVTVPYYVRKQHPANGIVIVGANFGKLSLITNIQVQFSNENIIYIWIERDVVRY